MLPSLRLEAGQARRSIVRFGRLELTPQAMDLASPVERCRGGLAGVALRDSVAGATVFVAGFDADQVSANTVTTERLPALGGGMRDIELVPWNLAQIRHKDQSEAFATFIVDALRDHIPLAPRPIDHAPLRVLESANMPAVLVEVGYLSNPAQEKQISGNDFQTTLVQGIVDAIVRYRDAVSPGEGASR